MEPRQVIQDAIDRLARLSVADAHRAGLPPVQLEVLEYLGKANRFSRTPSAVTAWLGSTKGTVSQSIAALERRGLLEKRRRNDRRSVSLDLTQAGAQMLADWREEGTRAILAQLGEEETRALSGLLRRVLHLRLAGRARPFGMCRECRHFRPGAKDGAPFRCALLDELLDDDDAGRICMEQEPA